MFEEIVVEEEEMSDSDGDWDNVDAVNANMMGAGYISSDDEEEGAIMLNDPNGLEASNNAWVWKSASP